MEGKEGGKESESFHYYERGEKLSVQKKIKNCPRPHSIMTLKWDRYFIKMKKAGK